MLFISNTNALISVKVFDILKSQGDLPSEVQIAGFGLLYVRVVAGAVDVILCFVQGRVGKAKPSLELPLVNTGQWAVSTQSVTHS